MRMRLVSPLLLVAVLGSLAGCAGGSEPRTGGEASGSAEQTTDDSSAPAGWSSSNDTTAPASRPSLSAAGERISGAERAQVLAASREVRKALHRWDTNVDACAVDTWTSCLTRPRTRLLLALFGVEGMLWRNRGDPQGPCRVAVRSAYDGVYGFRLSQARADNSDPAPGTAPSGDPDLANLQVAVDQVRHLPTALEVLAAAECAH